MWELAGKMVERSVEARHFTEMSDSQKSGIIRTFDNIIS